MDYAELERWIEECDVRINQLQGLLKEARKRKKHLEAILAGIDREIEEEARHSTEEENEGED